MNYNEWSAGKENLFLSLSSIIRGLDDIDFTNMSLLYELNHGDKTIPVKIENMDSERVAMLVALSYQTKWEKEWNYLKSELELGKIKEIIVEDSQKDDTIRVSTNDNVNSVSAFNDDEVSVNDSNEANTSDDIKHTYEKTSTQVEKDFSRINEQMKMLEASYITKMCQDVSKLLSLSIY